MGSDSDLTVMQEAAKVLEEFEISFEITVCSAHRTPERAHEYAASAIKRGLKVIIASAGGAALLLELVPAWQRAWRSGSIFARGVRKYARPIAGTHRFLARAIHRRPRIRRLPEPRAPEWRRLALQRGLEFDVDQLAAECRSLGEDIELRGDGTAEFASAGHAAAGGDDHLAGMSFEEVFDLGKRQAWLRDVFFFLRRCRETMKEVSRATGARNPAWES